VVKFNPLLSYIFVISFLFMLKAIIFDLDGTLTHTDPLHFSIWQSYLRDYGLEIDPPFYQQHISGKHNPDFLRQWLPQLSPQEIQQLSDDKEAYFCEVAQGQLQPLSGLITLLDWIGEKQLQSAVVTNAPRSNAEFMLQTLKIRSFWEIVIVSEELPWAKPHPFPYQEALRRLQVHPEEALVFEDSPSGIRSAIAAGIFTVGVSTTHSEQVLRQQGAKLVIDDFNSPLLQDIGVLI
jgi:HAD superfamily hydrolase (TIGR01509 family)